MRRSLPGCSGPSRGSGWIRSRSGRPRGSSDLDPDARVPLEKHFRLLAALPPIGLELGAVLGVDAMGVVGYAMQHEATVGIAMRWLHAHRATVFDDVVPRMEVADGRVVLSHVAPPALVRLREPCEAWVTAQIACMRALTGRALRPLAVSFQHAAPADLTRHAKLLAVPVRWSAPRIEVSFDAALLELPLERSDPALFGYLARRAEALRAELRDDVPLGDKVRRILGEELAHGEPGIDRVGHRLGLGARTLQRRLRDEDLSFAELLDEARRERALVLLDDPGLTAAEIAILVGYAEPAAFARAFKRWTGLTTQMHRAREATKADPA